MSPAPEDAREQPRDWAGMATERLDRYVGVIRDHSLVPATRFARVAVVGVFAALVALVLLLLLVVGLVHLFDRTVFRGHAFATDFTFGGIVLGAGVFLLWQSVKAGRTS
jgi:hypothetical protein